MRIAPPCCVSVTTKRTADHRWHRHALREDACIADLPAGFGVERRAIGTTAALAHREGRDLDAVLQDRHDLCRDQPPLRNRELDVASIFTPPRRST